MWNAQTEMLLEKTIYLLPTELTVWRGADEAEQVDNTMAFSLLVAAAAEAAFGSPISTDLDLATPSSRDRTHTPGETLLPILSPSPHRTAPLIRDQLTLWNSFEQPPHPHSIPVTITIYYQISKLVVYLPRWARADPTTRQFLHCCLCRYPRGKGLPFTDRLFACGAIVLVEWYALDAAENEEKKDAESTLWSRKCFHLPPARGITSKTRGSEKVLSLINAFSLSQVGHFHIAIDFFNYHWKFAGFKPLNI